MGKEQCLLAGQPRPKSAPDVGPHISQQASNGLCANSMVGSARRRPSFPHRKKRGNRKNKHRKSGRLRLVCGAGTTSRYKLRNLLAPKTSVVAQRLPITAAPTWLKLSANTVGAIRQLLQLRRWLL